MIQEKRRYARLPLDGSILLKTENGRIVATRGHLDNLSLGGFAMSATEGLSVGKEVEFFVRTPSLRDAVSGLGVVRNTEEKGPLARTRYKVGVQFINVDRNKVHRLIEKKRHGWDRKYAHLAHQKEDMLLALKWAPVLFLITWIVIQSFWQVNAAERANRQFYGQVKKGIVHFLYDAE